MIGLLQRVSTASVSVNNHTLAQIQQGLLALIGIEKDDSELQVDHLIDKILGYRVFSDQAGKMNLNLIDIQGELLLVPQFTLPADTKKGMRPSFSSAAPPETGKRLFEYLVTQAGNKYEKVSSGQFGADMQVSLINDGPVTFWLQT